jgi:adenylate kinase
MSKKLILMGLPGAGKGTQAAKLSDYYKINKLSTGEALRNSMAKKDALGQKISQVVNSGMLVSDDIVNDIIKNKVLYDHEYAKGFILDGYPRTIEQAKFLDNILHDDVIVINITMNKDELIIRLSGRVVCDDCGHTFNKHHKTDQGIICSNCGSDKYHQRDDDKESSVVKRLKVYDEQTKPLVEYYRDRGVLVETDGNKSVDDVFSNIIKAL